MATPTTIDASTFTPQQQQALANAASLAPKGTVSITGGGSAANTVGASPGYTPPAPSSGATARYPSGYSAPDTTDASGDTNPPAESSVDTAEKSYIASTTPEDPAAIADRISNEYASEIASIKQYYGTLLATQTTANQNESGKTRAQEAASGELGQDIGNAQSANQDTANQQALDKITAEEVNAVGAVQSQEAGATESEIQSEKAASQGAQQQNISFLSSRSQQTQSQIQTIAASTDLNSLPQDEYDSLYEASGFATPEQFNTYYNAARGSAQAGGKTIGDATTGVWQQQIDGTWKQIINGTANNVIGTPATGVWKKQSDGTYANVIPATAKVGSIGAGGSYVLNPTTGQISTVAPAANKIVSSGGNIYAVNPATNQATILTNNNQGWNSNLASASLEKAAIISYVTSLGLSGDDYNTLMGSIQQNSTAYYTALGNAAQAEFYTPTSIGTGTGQ